MSPHDTARPIAGDINGCHFPRDIHPRPKPRPALILAAYDDDAPQFTVRVACGTSQPTTMLHRGEFSILRERNSAAYEAAGCPPGKTPKLGTLQLSLVRDVQATFRANTA